MMVIMLKTTRRNVESKDDNENHGDFDEECKGGEISKDLYRI